VTPPPRRPSSRPAIRLPLGLLLAVAGTALRGADEPPRSAPTSQLRARASYRANDPSRPTVLLVHGMNSSSGGFQHVIPELERAGFGVLLYDYRFNRDLDAIVGEFVARWEAARERTGDRLPWAILTHSMGGLLARWYVEGPAYAGDVSTLVLIAPPNGGSGLARAQPIYALIDGQLGDRRRAEATAMRKLTTELNAAATDLSPGSDFLRRLNGRPRRAGVPYTIIAGDTGFLSRDARARIDAQLDAVLKVNRLLLGLGRLARREADAFLDDLTDGTGDGCVSVASTRLEGAPEPLVLHANHVELIRGPLLYPDPGPIVSWPLVELALKDARIAAERASARGPRPPSGAVGRSSKLGPP
jgi:alpha-beta hydrolase superfamily lysophospholipase